jgi:xanthosine phosphorylase
MDDPAQTAAARVRNLAPDFKPRVGLILGSGLGAVAESLTRRASIAYADMPGFPKGSVEGHSGHLVLGTLGGVALAVLQGRIHLYEGMHQDDIKTFVRVLKWLGCETVLLTTAAGSLRPGMGPGSLMLVEDHIGFLPGNPLIGPNDAIYGPRFPSMEGAYDLTLRNMMKMSAVRVDVPLQEGIFMGCLGPSFETPAEIRAFARLGADAVSMSTVPEVIVARHCGLRVAAISVITNYAAGMSGDALGHDQTLSAAGRAAGTLVRLLSAFFEDYARAPSA